MVRLVTQSERAFEPLLRESRRAAPGPLTAAVYNNIV